jgi:hypothetical protein
MGAKQAKEESESKHKNVRNVSFKLDPNNEIKYNESLSYTFSEFAANNFQSDITSEYTKELIDHSLLKLESLSDQIAALAVWITIQRFMGDLNDTEIKRESRITLVVYMNK